MNKKIDVNQTSFAVIEPILEDRQVLSKEKPPVWKRKKTLVISGIIIFTVLLMLRTALMQPAKPETNTQEPEEQPAASPTNELDPLQKRLEELEQSLKDSDPNKQDLPFPPVNMALDLI